jgi:hypothetical protein
MDEQLARMAEEIQHTRESVIHELTIAALAAPEDVPTIKRFVESLLGRPVEGESIIRSIIQHPQYALNENTRGILQIYDSVVTALSTFVTDFAVAYNEELARTIWTDEIPTFTVMYPAYLDCSDELEGIQTWFGDRVIDVSNAYPLLPAKHSTISALVRKFRVRRRCM